MYVKTYKHMSDKPKYDNRETWLLAAVELMRPLFKSANYDVPKIRVACGWPSTRGLSCKKRVLGEAWSKEAASDKVVQIFISPWVANATEAQGVFSILVHEVVHAVVGNENKHNKVFGKCARAVGLEGKLTSTFAGKKLTEAYDQWIAKLGPYPHAKLDALKRPTKKQTTRMVKCECGKCGYVARTTRKWLEEAGSPLCPQKHGPLSFELPDELEGDTDETED
jgi:hypothetical protein